MRRRDFITLLGSAAAAWPLAARAQQPGGVRRIGVLMNGDEGDPARRGDVASFSQALRKLGWIEGQNLGIEVRWSAGDAERARSLAGELLRLSPDMILAAATFNLTELLRLGPAMPIVFVLVSDPVEQGFVLSLAHPGGNITGFSAFEFSIGGKWIELLKRMAPGLAHVTLVYNPDTSLQSKFFASSIESAAPSLGVDAALSTVHAAADIERAIETASRRPNGGLIFPTDSFLTLHRKLVVDSAARYRVPAIYGNLFFAEAGGLMSYTTDFGDQFRQAAVYIDRILKGAKPGELPVQGPNKYSFVINLKAAKALGIEVPTNLLLIADDYIE
jgi:putative tryptophan/tyrosine transport system substrate-binding protein